MTRSNQSKEANVSIQHAHQAKYERTYPWTFRAYGHIRFLLQIRETCAKRSLDLKDSTLNSAGSRGLAAGGGRVLRGSKHLGGDQFVDVLLVKRVVEVCLQAR
jgi:hypothetical protein